MRILTRSGAALMNQQGKVLACAPRYIRFWGYHLALNSATTESHDWAAVYEWVFNCFEVGLSAGQRDVSVGGTTYSFETDGGVALVNGAEYKTGFRKIVIPLIQFGITDNSDNRTQIGRVIRWIVRDNEMLNYFQTGREFNSVNGTSPSWQVSYGGKIGYVTIIVPNDELRADAQLRMEQSVAAVKAEVKARTGYSVSDARKWTASDWEKRRNVVKIIHDWFILHTQYAPGDVRDETKYWEQTAYSALYNPQVGDPPIYPVCAGYSSAFAYLCKLYSINAVYVGGQVPEGSHAWIMLSLVLNMGEFDDDATKWAAIDLTYDDGMYDMAFSPYKTYVQNKQSIYQKNSWRCHTPVESPGPWTGAANWEQVTAAGAFTPWSYFATQAVYYKVAGALFPDADLDGSLYRVNSANDGNKGYPVAVPTANYPYYGDTLYGIAEADWTAPQGGGNDV